MDEKIKIIGIGDDGKNGIFPSYLEWINSAELLVGGERHLGFFPEFAQEKLTIKGNLADILELLQEREGHQRIVVLSSGDPLFFGIAQLFLRRFGEERVVVYPHLSSVQLIFSRIGLSWQDAYIESLHGRKMTGLAQRIDGKKKIALLTDVDNTPVAIADYLLSFGFTEYEMLVGEDLGSEQERVRRFALEDLAGQDFSPLNIVVLQEISANTPGFHLGIEDEEFFQRRPDKGLITKKEIRVISLSEMKLQPNSVVWDVGAGSGSISVEACKLAPSGQVFAIEKTASNLDNLRQNMKKFRTDFQVLHGSAPEVLVDLPAPDAIFIGGSGGNLADIIQLGCERLKKNGRIVLNAVMLETLTEAKTALEKKGFTTKINLIQVARSKPIIGMTRFEGLNPVYIITAYRKQDYIEKRRLGEHGTFKYHRSFVRSRLRTGGP